MSHHRNKRRNAAIFIDYENIFALLAEYGVNPLDINFFPVILDRIRQTYNISLCIAYCNFEHQSFQDKHQTTLHNFGIQTRHSVNSGKNSSDIMLTVDTVATLYRNPDISVFVLVSSDRDIIPILQELKLRQRQTYVLSTRNGFNKVVTTLVDKHEYIEDLFHITPEMLINHGGEKLNIDISIDDVTKKEMEQAWEVAQLFYSSNILKKSEEDNDLVTLKGYAKTASRKLDRDEVQIVKDFKLAHFLNYVTLFRDKESGLCLKKGERYEEFISNCNAGDNERTNKDDQSKNK
jgi:uncharacterized LabA/DUF88 family protein